MRALARDPRSPWTRGRAARGAALAAALLTAAMTAPAPAFADDGADPAADAATQFAEAQRRYDEHDFAGALGLFQHALDASGSPNARLYVARCLRELDRLPEAYAQMRTTVRDATARAETEPKYVQTRDAAAAELALLEARVGRLIIAIADPPPGVVVRVDGQLMPADRLGSPTAVKPGALKITAAAPDGGTLVREVTVRAGETQTIALTLGRPGPRRSAPPPQPAPARSGGGVRTAGFVVAGLGVAGAVLFGVSAAMADSKFTTLETECGGVRCADPKYADVVDSGKTFDTLATAGLIAGIAGLTAGGVMILLGGPSDEPAAAGNVALTLTPASASAAVTF